MDKLYVIVLVAMLNQETGELITNNLTELELVNFVTPVVSFSPGRERSIAMMGFN
jgi:hypothetical protein